MYLQYFLTNVTSKPDKVIVNEEADEWEIIDTKIPFPDFKNVFLCFLTSQFSFKSILSPQSQAESVTVINVR